MYACRACYRFQDQSAQSGVSGLVLNILCTEEGKCPTARHAAIASAQVKLETLWVGSEQDKSTCAPCLEPS